MYYSDHDINGYIEQAQVRNTLISPLAIATSWIYGCVAMYVHSCMH